MEKNIINNQKSQNNNQKEQNKKDDLTDWENWCYNYPIHAIEKNLFSDNYEYRMIWILYIMIVWVERKMFTIQIWNKCRIYGSFA